MTTLTLRAETRLLEPTTTKACPGATGQIPHVVAVALFSPDRSRRDGMAPYCRSCAAVKQKEWKHRNPEKVRAAKAKYRKGDDVLYRGRVPESDE